METIGEREVVSSAHKSRVGVVAVIRYCIKWKISVWSLSKRYSIDEYGLKEKVKGVVRDCVPLPYRLTAREITNERTGMGTYVCMR